MSYTSGEDKSFQLKTTEPEHNCQRIRIHKDATSGWVAREFEDKIKQRLR